MTVLSRPMAEVQTEAAEIASAPRLRRPVSEWRSTRIAAPMLAVAVILGLWELAGMYLISPLLISSPQQALADFVDQFSSGPAVPALEISLRELYVGIAIGLSAGVVIGLVVGRYRLLDAALSPYINAANATPLNVLIPLLIVWVGIGTEARVLFIVLISFFPVLLNTAGGLRNVSKGYVEVGRMLGLNEHQLMRKVILPASMPYVFAGIRLGVALGVIGMIVGEIEESNVGLGYYINFYGDGFQTGKLLALIFLAALIGVLNVLVIRGIQARWFRWISAAR
ncbi:MAG: ABC transporter permease [Actinomycetota bacterium]|nr:ABC transporter permease [Actinomycetota bacterium]